MLARRFVVLALLGLAGGAALFAALGESLAWGMVTIAERWLLFGFAPVAYVASAAGLGVPIARAVGAGAASWTIRTGLGLAALLTLTHALGALGVLSPLLAWLALAPGIALLAHALWREGRHPAGDTSLVQRLECTLASRWALPGAVAAGVMLAAACMPPGMRWRSEFGGFDSLSYHLQLPKEWLLAGQISTLEHNVYSGLPSYLEAAFMHLALLRKPPMTGEAPGMLSDHGASLIAAQQLHALLGVLACVGAARVARELAERRGVSSATARGASGLVFSLLALTPWTLVTGSLSYNEQGVALLGTCAALVLLAHAAPVRRVLALALLIGAAVGVKPTAMLFLGLPAGVVVLAMLVQGVRRATMRSGVAITALVVGVLAGSCMLAPWMLRNAAATRNPVFPFAASVFPNADKGTGWWNSEQVARFSQSHTFTGSVSDRVRLAFVPDANDPVRPSWRGMTNPQWGLLLLAGVLSAFICVALAAKRAAPSHALGTRSPEEFADDGKSAARALAIALVVVIVLQLLLWLFATHIQSRFLLPVALPAALALGLLVALVHHAPVRALLMIALLGGQALFFVRALLIESDRGPAAGLLAVPSDFMGIPANPRVSPQELSPVAFINRELPVDATVLLLGDATPLYITKGVRYATTYDTSPLFSLAGADPADVASWSGALKSSGVTHVLVNLSELDRYRRSGFLDPRLDMGRIQTWATGLGAPVAVWPGGVALFELR